MMRVPTDAPRSSPPSPPRTCLVTECTATGRSRRRRAGSNRGAATQRTSRRGGLTEGAPQQTGMRHRSPRFWSRTAARSRFASCAARANWAARRLRSTATPIATRGTCGSPTKPIIWARRRRRNRYLNVEKILDAVRRSGADAVHPGYGFFAENAAFARASIAAGDDVDRSARRTRSTRWATKCARARRWSRPACRSCPAGSVNDRQIATAARAAAEDTACRSRSKPRAAAAARGSRSRARSTRLRVGVRQRARREAGAYFGNPTIYAERYLDNPKHVELQMLADKHGTCCTSASAIVRCSAGIRNSWEESAGAA